MAKFRKVNRFEIVMKVILTVVLALFFFAVTFCCLSGIVWIIGHREDLLNRISGSISLGQLAVPFALGLLVCGIIGLLKPSEKSDDYYTQFYSSSGSRSMHDDLDASLAAFQDTLKHGLDFVPDAETPTGDADSFPPPETYPDSSNQ